MGVRAREVLARNTEMRGCVGNFVEPGDPLGNVREVEEFLFLYDPRCSLKDRNGGRTKERHEMLSAHKEDVNCVPFIRPRSRSC